MKWYWWLLIGAVVVIIAIFAIPWKMLDPEYKRKVETLANKARPAKAKLNGQAEPEEEEPEEEEGHNTPGNVEEPTG